MVRPDAPAESPTPVLPRSARQVILHADDLGLNAAVTDGILRGFAEGLLTSTSLMSNAPDADRALEAWKQLERRHAQGDLPSAARRARLGDPACPFDLGIHLNLTQGRPLTGERFPPELLDSHGRFPGILGLFRRLRRSGPAVAAAIEAELQRQIEFMLERGRRPTHLNGHQYIEMLPIVNRVVIDLLERHAVPVVRIAWQPCWWRSFIWPGVSTVQWLLGGVKKRYAAAFRRVIAAGKISSADAFFGTMTAGTTSLPTVRAFLAAIGDSRSVEIGLHPGDAPKSAGSAQRQSSTRSDDEAWRDPLAELRPRELAMVVSTDMDEELAVNNCRLGRLAEIGTARGAP